MRCERCEIKGRVITIYYECLLLPRTSNQISNFIELIGIYYFSNSISLFWLISVNSLFFN